MEVDKHAGLKDKEVRDFLGKSIGLYGYGNEELLVLLKGRMEGLEEELTEKFLMMKKDYYCGVLNE